jgi:hypothetical protein
MYIDLASDYPAYVFMVVFIVFLVYVIVVGNKKDTSDTEKKIDTLFKKK